MTNFDERERAFETKFAHDAELRFRAQALRDRMLGEWAAGLLDLSGEDAAAYARELIAADLTPGGGREMLERLKRDLEGIASESDIRNRMAEAEVEARRQVLGEL